MATLQLEQLECIHPNDPTTDEIVLRVARDGGGTCYEINRSMHEGETLDLTTDPGIPFTDYAVIRLSESDPTHEDRLGSVTINRPLPDAPRSAYLPSEIGGEHSTCYRLTYHVDTGEEDAVARRNRIELLSLKCDDAQGTHDHVLLYVNEVRMWGPSDMTTGREIDWADLSANFRSSATVRLQETRGEDWQSQFTLRYGEEDYRLNTRLTHRFRVDRGIIGDASYTLTYRLRRLPAR